MRAQLERTLTEAGPGLGIGCAQPRRGIVQHGDGSLIPRVRAGGELRRHLGRECARGQQDLGGLPVECPPDRGRWRRANGLADDVMMEGKQLAVGYEHARVDELGGWPDQGSR